eukprot:gene3913-2781_t
MRSVAGCRDPVHQADFSCEVLPQSHKFGGRKGPITKNNNNNNNKLSSCCIACAIIVQRIAVQEGKKKRKKKEEISLRSVRMNSNVLYYDDICFYHAAVILIRMCDFMCEREKE